jgi:hypothetical protein
LAQEHLHDHRHRHDYHDYHDYHDHGPVPVHDRVLARL